MSERTPGPIHTHSPANGPITTCPRCKLDMAAPELLEVCEEILRAAYRFELHIGPQRAQRIVDLLGELDITVPR